MREQGPAQRELCTVAIETKLCTGLLCFIVFFVDSFFTVIIRVNSIPGALIPCVAVPFQWHDFGMPFKQEDVPAGAGQLRFIFFFSPPSLLFITEASLSSGA